WEEHDDRPAPLPHRTDTAVNWAGTRDAVFLPADRLFGLEYGREAENVNSVDEVPDSSWFHDPRRDPLAPGGWGVRVLSPEEGDRGGVTPDDEPVFPVTVLHGKVGGSAAGFVVRDARGHKFQFKLDPWGRAGLVSSTEVVATRLAWAAGFRTAAEM